MSKDPAAATIPLELPDFTAGSVPGAAASNESAQGPERRLRARREGRVLIIDDDPFVRTVVARQVQALGLRAVTAGDGSSAIHALQEQGPFDLMICDLKMPGTDAVELLRDLSGQTFPGAIILMSTADDPTLRAAREVARMRHFRMLGTLKKPTTITALKILIDRVGDHTTPVRAKPAVEHVTVDELRGALAAGEMDIFVQPEVELVSGRLAGVEALARWIKPDGRIIGPEAFISVADRHGLMDSLTTVVVRQALGACSRWRTGGLHTNISINLPVESMDQLDLPDWLSAEAARFSLPPERIVIEVTETGKVKNLANALDVVTRLRLRGFRLSIDDFGTGYASLEQLRWFPFTELKLDRVFVDGASCDSGLRSIASSSLRMARELELNSCAEGIETQADYDLMRDLGCELAQGYHIARPMPKNDLPAWAAARASYKSG